MNIHFSKLASDSDRVALSDSDRVALLALKMSLTIENRRSTVALDGMAVLNFRTVRCVVYIFK